MYQRILVPTDGSSLSKKAVKSAIEQASVMGAELIALYVVPRYPLSYFEGGISVSDAEVARTEKQWADKGQAVVDEVQKAAKASGVEAKLCRVGLDGERAGGRSHYSSYIVKSRLRAPHTGQNQSLGISSNGVPGGMPPSGSPSAGS